MAELSIGQVSRRVGVSARTLRHWDQFGLFTPTKVSGNGYRWYDEAQLPRLYRIIALRRNGLGLDEIRDVTVGGDGEAESLRIHIDTLRVERDRLDRLISTLEEHVVSLENASPYDEERHEREFSAFTTRLDDRFGKAVSEITGSLPPTAMTDADVTHMSAQQSRLLQKLADLMTAGAAATSAEVLDVVAEHYAAVSQFWTPSASAYRALGKMYVDDPLQRGFVDTIDPALSEWLAEAIAAYAEQRMPL